MLNKKSGLTYCDVRERYENFRSRCTLDEVKKKIMKTKKTKKTKKGEKGCTEPFYGKKSKCVIKIVPKNKRVKTFQMDEKCKKNKTYKKKRGGSKKISKKEKEKIKNVLKIKRIEQEINVSKLKFDLLKKKLGGPRKFKSTTLKHKKYKKRKTKKRIKKK